MSWTRKICLVACAFVLVGCSAQNTKPFYPANNVDQMKLSDNQERCCQTNGNSHQLASAAWIYALNNWRHSARAAVRLNLKLSRE